MTNGKWQQFPDHLLQLDNSQFSNFVNWTFLWTVSIHRESLSAMPTPQALTRPPITTELDLCLYRVVSELCRGRILPFGVRQLIKDYAWASFDNDTIREAVQLWCRNRAIAIQRFGDINEWDVNQRLTSTSRWTRGM